MVAMLSLARLLVSEAGRFDPCGRDLDSMICFSQRHTVTSGIKNNNPIDGLDVVDKIEGVGSQSGKTSKSVVVKECGEILD
jgi:hypothetical protein